MTSLSDETFARSVRLGRIVPKTKASNVITAPIPVSRPIVVFQEYPLAVDILRITSDFYNVSVIDIKSARRSDRIVRPRQICMYLMRTLTLMSLPMVGKVVCKDHTTSMYGANKIEKEAKENPRLRDEIDLLKIKIADDMTAKNAARLAAAQ